jgi:erythromycin esterase-like protein
MRLRTLLIAILLILPCCSKPSENTDAVPQVEHKPLYEFPSVDTLNSTDLDPVRDALKSKTIAMLGESMYLAAEFSSARDLLTRNLHEGADFNLLLFEGSPVEFWIAEEQYAASKKDVLSAADFQKTAMLGFWQTEEVRSVINYALRSQAGAGRSDLYMSAFGVEIGKGRRFTKGDNVFETLVRLLRDRDKKLSLSEEEMILPLEGLVACAQKGFPESDETYEKVEQGIAALSQIVERTLKNNDEIHEKTLKLLPKAVGYSLEYCREAIQATKNDAEMRDEWASRQFADIMSTLNQKAIIWAHSNRLRQAAGKDARSTFGTYVRSVFAEEVFTIDFVAGSGSAVDFLDDKGAEMSPVEKMLVPLEKVSLEEKLSRLGSRDLFVTVENLPSQFSFEETTRREPDAVMTINPRKDFDAYYFIRKVTAPDLKYLR